MSGPPLSAPLAPGRIFWAVYPGDRGDGKLRPMIAVSRRADVVRTGNVFAVVCSTRFTEPIQDDEVRIPSRAEGKCATMLESPTVAVCNWTATLPLNQIHSVGGLVPTAVLREICSKAGVVYKPER